MTINSKSECVQICKGQKESNRVQLSEFDMCCQRLLQHAQHVLLGICPVQHSNLVLHDEACSPLSFMSKSAVRHEAVAGKNCINTGTPDLDCHAPRP
jgi:hypothetical protein